VIARIARDQFFIPGHGRRPLAPESAVAVVASKSFARRQFRKFGDYGYPARIALASE
jgi:hypothetical protein